MGHEQLLTVGLVILGWWIVHNATLNRERRKEKRELASKICKEIWDLQQAAIDFHTNPEYSGRKATDLAQLVSRIITQLQKAPLDELKVPHIRMIDLRRRITLRNCEKTEFATQDHESDFIAELRNAAADLVYFVEDAKEEQWK